MAFVGNITVLSQPGFVPEIKKSCTPAIGIDFGPEWGTEPCLFPQGGGWNESITDLVRQAVDRKHSKLGLLYCVEINTCSSIGKQIEAVAEREGIALVYSSAISLTQTDYTAQCQHAKNAGVEELIVAMEGSAVARLARSCLALKFRPLLLGAAARKKPLTPAAIFAGWNKVHNETPDSLTASLDFTVKSSRAAAAVSAQCAG